MVTGRQLDDLRRVCQRVVREIEGSDAPATVSEARVRQAIYATYTLPG